MKREQVRIVVESAVSEQCARTIGVFVDDELMGQLIVEKGAPFVAEALILAGFGTIDVSGVGLKASVTELWHVRKAAFQAGTRLSPKVDGHRGHIALKKFHVVGMDKCMFDVFFNGVGAWKWAEPYLDDVDALATILQEAPFEVSVEHVQAQPAVAPLKAA
jgi:hypothetical protein